LLDKKDTLNLYYAASTYVIANDYDKALPAYYELKNLNFSGKSTVYWLGYEQVELKIHLKQLQREIEW
jgi:hypothetical protein